MIDRRDPDFVQKYFCDSCGKEMFERDKYKYRYDGTKECQECIELDLIEVKERERKSTEEIF